MSELIKDIQEVDGCDFCKQLAGVNHKSNECYLNCSGDTLDIDVDIPLSWGSATESYRFDINYCPFCGKKLK